MNKMFRFTLLLFVLVNLAVDHGEATDEVKMLTMALKNNPNNFSRPKIILKIKIPEYIASDPMTMRKSYLTDMAEGQYSNALAKMAKLVKEREATGLVDEDSLYKMLLVRCDRMAALIKMNRNIEALIEARKALKVARGENAVAISTMLSELPDTLNDYEKMQVNITDDKEYALKRWFHMLQPERFPDMDKEDHEYFASLGKQIQEAFRRLTKKDPSDIIESQSAKESQENAESTSQ